MDGVIAAPQPIAVEEGARVLRAGGNAVDAAVATAFVQGIVDPTNCGLGGWGVIHVRGASGNSEVIQFYSPLPQTMPPDLFARDVVGGVGRWNVFQVKNWANNIGYKSVGVPGTVRGSSEALARWGTWTWEDVLEPAMRWAREGVVVDTELALRFAPPHEVDDGGPRMIDRLTATPAAAALYTRGGRTLRPGELMVHRDAADTLERLATAGADDFYEGEIGSAIVRDFAANGGYLSDADLSNYRTRSGGPIVGRYHEYRIETSPPPTGGLTILEILNILEGFDLTELGHNSADYVHVVTEAFRCAFADRLEFIGDPLFVDVPTERLGSKAHATQRRRLIDLSRRIELGDPASLRPATSGSTTHVSVVDRDGNAVSLTHTLALSSSGVATPGLGFLYNNSAALYNPFPGHANSMDGGRMRANGASPTMVYRDDKLIMVIGSPGGHGIITGVVQVILNVLHFGMTAVEAVSAARFHCEHGPVQLESRIPDAVRQDLARRGHRIENLLVAYGYATGAVQLVMIDHDTGTVSGAADPRRGGMVLRPDTMTDR